MTDLADAVARQRGYYSSTASAYDGMHVDLEHARALTYLAPLLDAHGIESVLDVGSGTGRATEFLMASSPQRQVVGVEPVFALIEQARTCGKKSAGRMVQGSGESLPFADAAFDCACEFAVLHHVPEPARVVAEMIRVARKMVCLSDENRFGMVGFPRNAIQYGIYKTGQWRRFYWLWTRGKGFQFSEADGVRFSYSVYDSFDQLAAWADEIVLIPTSAARRRSWFHPLFTSSHVLLCAFRRDAQPSEHT